MDMETLRQICAGPSRVGPYGIDRPFAFNNIWRDNYVYATDGHVIVRITGACEDFPGPNRFRDIILDLPWSVLEAGRRFRVRREAVLSLLDNRPCTDCSPETETKECIKCHGEGCSDCDDEGWIYNTKDCPNCLGTGRWNHEKHWQVGPEYIIGLAQLARIVMLCGDIELFVGNDNTKPVGFRFAGGEGLLMPVRWGEHVKPINNSQEAGKLEGEEGEGC